MDITITIDDPIYQKALELADAGLDLADLFHAALSTFFRVQTAKRLATLGGPAASMQNVPRRRF